MATFQLVSVDASRYRCRKVTPFLVKHLWLMTLDAYLLALCCRKSSNSVFLIGFLVFLATTDNQFGFKKGLSCSHAIYSIRSVIDEYVAGWFTVNVCALDLSKVFDRMNHVALFIKLMNGNTPVNLLAVIEKWFAISVVCVKWGDRMSIFFKLVSGVRQGGVLSPSLFAIYVDDITKKIIAGDVGGHMSFICTCIFPYTGDLFLIAPSLHTLQIMLNVYFRSAPSRTFKIWITHSRCNLTMTTRWRHFSHANSHCRYHVYAVFVRRQRQFSVTIFTKMHLG